MNTTRHSETIEVITRDQRRRRWSLGEKQALVRRTYDHVSFVAISLLNMSLFQVRESATDGLGVFATTAIPRRSFIAAYIGRRYRAGEALAEVTNGITYLFALSDGRTIDGGEGGNETKYINHSCRPNCKAVEVYDKDDDLVIEIRAKRGIRAGEELFLDYALIVSESHEGEYVCLCKERVCRGSMVAAR